MINTKMVVPTLFLCTCVALLAAANGAPWHGTLWPSRSHYQTIVVDRSGHGNFTSIQAAIDFVSEDNKKWICIRVRTGTYRFMSFRNSYNSPLNKNRRAPAVAAMITGDKSALYRCGFFGLQDTLWNDQGRHYYYRCTIQGAVDFIFGGGQSIFESCGISVIGEALPQGLPGFITAQGRTSPNDANGFVFKSCVVYGSGSTFLGRPWRSFSRVLFYNSSFSSVVDPKGWDASSFSGYENRLTFAEHSCYGEGADTSKRVRWEKNLSGEDLKEMSSIKFIDSEGWLMNQPI